jgi:uncharacterized membrane-anchored protein YhcB (DUF1043 family)
LEKTTIVSFDAKSYAANATGENLDSFFGPLIKFFDRATNLYGVPFFAILLIFFAIFILGFVFNNIIGSVFGLVFGCCKINLTKNKTKQDMWFDARVQSSEMADEFDLYKSLHQGKYYTVPEVKKLTQDRLNIYNSRIKKRNQTQSHKKVLKFQTLASYNFRMNPNFKYLFIKSKEQLYGSKVF